MGSTAAPMRYGRSRCSISRASEGAWADPLEARDAGVFRELPAASICYRPLLALRIFELGQRLDGVLRGAGENEFAVLELNLLNRDGDVVSSHPRETTRTDDHEGQLARGRDDEIVYLPDLLLRLVEDRLADDLLFGAPSRGHYLDLLHGDAEPGRPGHLGHRVATRHESQRAR